MTCITHDIALKLFDYLTYREAMSLHLSCKIMYYQSASAYFEKYIGYIQSNIDIYAVTSCDNVELFKIYIVGSNPSIVYLAGIIRTAIEHDSINIIKYIYSNLYSYPHKDICKLLYVPTYMRNDDEIYNDTIVLQFAKTAICNNRVDIFNLMHVNMFCCIDENAADIAAGHGSHDMLRLLLNKYDLRVSYCGANTAASNGHVDMVKYLYSIGYTCTTSAINLAAFHGHFEMVRFLYGASIAYTSEVLDNAIIGGHLGIAQWLYHELGLVCSTYALTWSLCKPNVIPDPETFVEDLLQGSIVLPSPKHFRFDILRWINETGMHDEWCADLANSIALSGNVEFAAYVQEHHPECLSNGITHISVQYAAYGGHLDMIKWIRLHYRCWHMHASIEMAASMGHAETMAWLIDNYLGVEFLYSDTIINIAIIQNHVNIIELLPIYTHHSITVDACEISAFNGNVEAMTWLYENTGYTLHDSLWFELIECDQQDIILYMISAYPPNMVSELVALVFANGSHHLCKKILMHHLDKCTNIDIADIVSIGNIDFINWAYTTMRTITMDMLLICAIERNKVHVAEWIHTKSPHIFNYKHKQRAINLNHIAMMQYLAYIKLY